MLKYRNVVIPHPVVLLRCLITFINVMLMKIFNHYLQSFIDVTIVIVVVIHKVGPFGAITNLMMRILKKLRQQNVSIMKLLRILTAVRSLTGEF